MHAIRNIKRQSPTCSRHRQQARNLRRGRQAPKHTQHRSRGQDDRFGASARAGAPQAATLDPDRQAACAPKPKDGRKRGGRAGDGLPRRDRPSSRPPRKDLLRLTTSSTRPTMGEGSSKLFFAPLPAASDRRSATNGTSLSGACRNCCPHPLNKRLRVYSLV